jgi:RNA recognition motif-containing protein
MTVGTEMRHVEQVEVLRERDRRTVFVQQLAARLRTKELIAFFEKVGPVKEAQIVKDRVSGRSKG